MEKIDAIIVSAGKGARFGSNQPKQYTSLLGKPLIQWTIDVFAQSPIIDKIIVVVSPEFKDFFNSNSNVSETVIGGTHRVESVLNGIKASEVDFVAIHDGARPLVSSEKITKVCEIALKKDAAILAIPANETIKRASKSIIVDTPSREELYMARTPQVFRKDLILKALKSLPKGFVPTDDAQAVELYGQDVHIVLDDPTNIKITYPHDIYLAQAILKNQK